MGDGNRLPTDGADPVSNGAADNDGTVVPSRLWYRDPVLLVPAAVTIIAAIIALVPYFFPQQSPDGHGTGKYIDPEKCLTVAWPGPGTAMPQQVRADRDVAEYAILRQKPCWRALKPQPSTRFTPAAGISVLCWVNADNVIDTSEVSRYGWYLVADPAHPGQTIGWTPQWPYGAPSQDVPTCGQHAQGWLSPVTLVAATLACITAVCLIVLAIKRRHRDLPQPAGPSAIDNDQP